MIGVGSVTVVVGWVRIVCYVCYDTIYLVISIHIVGDSVTRGGEVVCVRVYFGVGSPQKPFAREGCVSEVTSDAAVLVPWSTGGVSAL